jgi:hypothetical protein
VRPSVPAIGRVCQVGAAFYVGALIWRIM